MLKKNLWHWFFVDEEKHQQQQKLNWIAFALVSLFFIGFKFLFHELWKDEWQAWFIANELNFGALFSFLYYDGHPSLWYLFLKFSGAILSPLNGVFGNAGIIQLGHSILVACALYVFFIKLRFSLPMKMLSIFGFFLFFEYGILNRGYILVILALWLFAWLVENKQRHYWKIAILLLLLCQTEVYGMFMAFACTVYLLFDHDLKWKSKSFYIPAILFTIGVVLFLITMVPPSEGTDVTFHYFNQINGTRFLNAFQAIFTNTILIGLLPDVATVNYKITGILTSAILLIISIWCFKSKKSLATYLAWLIPFYLFTAMIYTGGLRQWGMFICFIIFLFYIIHREQKTVNVLAAAFIGIMLTFQLFYSGKIAFKEATTPFTNAKMAGNFIAENIPKNTPIIAFHKPDAVPVMGYADRKFFALPQGKKFTVFKWREQMFIPLNKDLDKFLKDKRKDRLAILTNKPISSKQIQNIGLVKKFDTYNIRQEIYYIYGYPAK